MTTPGSSSSIYFYSVQQGTYKNITGIETGMIN